MRRVACVFGLIALAALVLMIVRLDGATAIVFSFVGYPALCIALLVYGFVRWREGAFHLTRRQPDDRTAD
jgi:hypothetical protein